MQQVISRFPVEIKVIIKRHPALGKILLSLLSRTVFLNCRDVPTKLKGVGKNFKNDKYFTKWTKFLFLVVFSCLLFTKIYLSQKSAAVAVLQTRVLMSQWLCYQTVLAVEAIWFWKKLQCKPKNSLDKISILPGTFILTFFFPSFCILYPQGFNGSINLALENIMHLLYFKCW